MVDLDVVAAKTGAILTRKEAIPTDLSIVLAGLAGFRDIGVHRYGDLDLGLAHEELAPRLDALEQLAGELLGRAAAE